MEPSAILRFWFDEHGPNDWFREDPAFDRLIEERFGKALALAEEGGTSAWRATVDGRLAEVILLDQFTRNIHRGTVDAFKNDARALALAREAVAVGADRDVDPMRRQFFYMPYMHSESRETHAEALPLFVALGNPHALKYEQEHKALIDRFGRYPYRNRALERISTPEEETYLAEHPRGF